MTLYSKNRKNIFTMIHTIFNRISEVASTSATKDTIELAIIRITCNHVDMKLCFRKLSYLPSWNEPSSIVSIYQSLLLDCILMSYIIILIL